MLDDLFLPISKNIRQTTLNAPSPDHTYAGFCDIARLVDPLLQHIPTWDPTNQSHMQDALRQMGGHAKGERPRVISARRATKPALDLLRRLRLKSEDPAEVDGAMSTKKNDGSARRRRQLRPLPEKHKPAAFQTMSCWRNGYINSSSLPAHTRKSP